MCSDYVRRRNRLTSSNLQKGGIRHEVSLCNEKRIVAMVDSFTKTVSRNFSRNPKQAKANAEKYHSDKPADYFLEALSHDGRYPSNYFVLYADQLSCVVHSETLYKALCSLPDKQRKVLPFDFWGALPDVELWYSTVDYVTIYEEKSWCLLSATDGR